jgi:hypothetical protein
MSDRDLANLVGNSEITIAKARAKFKIPAYRATASRAERLTQGTKLKKAQQALSAWPHRLQGVGLDANLLLAALHQAGAAGLTVTQCRAITRSHPLGVLAKHSLTHLTSRAPELRYALTPKGQAYHDLLQHHNLLPQHA